jgi:hypothetical protein
LSVTQRRILTLLDSPGRLRDLALRPMVNTAWLTRDAAQLQKAGLIVFDSADGAPRAAANADSVVLPPARPISRPLTIAIVAAAASVLVWVGWHFSAAPTVERTRTGVSRAPTPVEVQAPVPTVEPPVIATRVLRGDPRDLTKDARAASAKTSAPAGSTDASRPSTSEVARPIVVEPRVPRTESINASKPREPQSAVDSNAVAAGINTRSRVESSRVESPSPRVESPSRTEGGVRSESRAATLSDSVTSEGER